MNNNLPDWRDPHPRKSVAISGVRMRYVDTGRESGKPVVFLHGNPTSSYLWRNIIPLVSDSYRCLAPDLVGMGDSERPANGEFTFKDHAYYLDGWFDALRIKDVVLVLHDWGSALGFDWARRNPDKISGLVYMEALVQPLSWKDWPENAKGIFQAMRSDAGEEIVLQKNVFVERILPASVLRGLTDKEMAVYRKPFQEPGETRRPTLTWPRQIPIDGEPEDVTTVIQSYSLWLSQSTKPKLFVNAEPGSILVGPQRDFCRTWPNQTEVTVPGIHFIQEDSPDKIGSALTGFLSSLSASDRT